MAGTKINDYAIGDANIQSVMLTLDKAFRNNFTIDPASKYITAGSVIECNGAFYKFDSNELPSGSKSGTYQDNFIQLVPSGDSITAQWTTTAPTWSDSKQGYYGTSSAANYRYIYVETGNGYYKKHLKNKSDYGLIISLENCASATFNTTTLTKFSISGTPSTGDCIRGASISSGEILFGSETYLKYFNYLITYKIQCSSHNGLPFNAFVGLSGSPLISSTTSYYNFTSYANAFNFLVPSDLFGAAGTLSVHGQAPASAVNASMGLSIEIIGQGDNY